APLLALATLGTAWAIAGPEAPAASGPAVAPGGWLGAMLLLMFAYGGYESALIPLSEATNPRRDAPFALLVGLTLVTVVYVGVQITVLAALPDPDATDRPLAAAVRV